MTIDKGGPSRENDKKYSQIVLDGLYEIYIRELMREFYVMYASRKSDNRVIFESNINTIRPANWIERLLGIRSAVDMAKKALKQCKRDRFCVQRKQAYNAELQLELDKILDTTKE
jgi:hypothetical protein